VVPWKRTIRGSSAAADTTGGVLGRSASSDSFPAVPGAKITLREAQAIAHLLEHGRWPDPDTAMWMEEHTSRVALDYLLAVRLRGAIAVAEEQKGKR
jgi:hypothetical protein